MEGIIIKNISNDYTVLVKNQLYTCKSRGKFRNLHITPVVGDYVEFDEQKNCIENILPRKNSLVRPPIANIDQAILVTSVKNPDFSTNLLDKLLVTIEYNSIKPIICLTKMDLLTEEEKENIKPILEYYKKIGYTVIENKEIDTIKELFKKKVTVLTGQSGAGKSTLLNRIDSTLQLKTDDISYALGRGKHTTRHVELLPIESGFVADTPGFSSLQFSMLGMDKTAIRDNFIEFEEYKEHCKYKDCMHIKENDCFVKENVGKSILETRYQNYVKFIEEIR